MLEQFDVSLEEAKELVLTARVLLGYIDADEMVAQQAADAEAAAAAEAGEEEEAES